MLCLPSWLCLSSWLCLPPWRICLYSLAAADFSSPVSLPSPFLSCFLVNAAKSPDLLWPLLLELPCELFLELPRELLLELACELLWWRICLYSL